MCVLCVCGVLQKAILEAREALGVKVELVGALGKRTRYQERELAQLLLSVSLDDPSSSEREGEHSDIGECELCSQHTHIARTHTHHPSIHKLHTLRENFLE